MVKTVGEQWCQDTAGRVEDEYETHPAAAISAKSCSVIQVFQWFWRADRAVLWS